MNHFLQNNLDKFLLIIMTFIFLYFYLQSPDNKTLENITWLSFGGVLALLGVKRTSSPTINAQNLDTDSINVGEK